MSPIDSPDWLSADEQETWLALVGVLVRLPAAIDAQLQREANLSHFEYQVLAGLSMAPDDTLRLSALSVFCGGSLARLSQVVTRLEKRGFLRKSPDPDDGRSTRATLTEEGRSKITETAPGHVAHVRQLVFDSTSKIEQRQLREACLGILEAIDPDRIFRDQLAQLSEDSPSPEQHPH